MTTPMPMTDEQLRETLWVSRRCPNAPFEPEVGRALAREVLHLRAQRDDLQARATALVEERRAAVAERDHAESVVEGLMRYVDEAKKAAGSMYVTGRPLADVMRDFWAALREVEAERDAARELAALRAAPLKAPSVQVAADRAAARIFGLCVERALRTTSGPVTVGDIAAVLVNEFRDFAGITGAGEEVHHA